MTSGHPTPDIGATPATPDAIKLAGAPHALVLMCSGQGSQKPGMGRDLIDIPHVARAVECASDAFGLDVRLLVTQADEEALSNTLAAQAAISALTVGIGHALDARGVTPDAVLGFSLGQASALALSGMLSDEDAFALINARARIMEQTTREHPGAMSALLKADEHSARELCEECAQGEVLVPANYNCPGQIVISGTVGAIERAEEAWRARKGRASRLATQGAFHSPLMSEACAPFAAFLDTLEFAEPRIPLICNTDARPLTAYEVRKRLTAHLVSPVLFQQSAQMLLASGASCFIEAGYGGVLANLMKRIDRVTQRFCVQDRESLDAFVRQWEEQREERDGAPGSNAGNAPEKSAPSSSHEGFPEDTSKKTQETR